MTTNMTLIRRAFALSLATLLTASAALASDTSMLKPPPGSNVALVLFEDLECPKCAQDAPLFAEAARTYKIPLVVHDFPLNMHPWAFDAAVLAVFFDSKSKKLGDDFRDYIFKNQPLITKSNLRSYAEKFAADQKVDLPFAVDPQGQFTAKVKADQDLGMRIPLEHTPTIFVVGNKAQGQPYVEVTDNNQLFQIIDQMKKEAIPLPGASKTPAKTGSSKTAKTAAKTTKQ